jgi:site-specific DNA-methyltransferase (adenine-specific)
MKTAELKVLPVANLKPAEYNPRKKLKPGDKEYQKIKDSIAEFGFADPLVVNADMTIIGGHQRLTVAMDLGFTEVPCAVVDIDKTREKALNINSGDRTHNISFTWLAICTFG